MRYIKLTEELKQKAMQDFAERLLNERFSDTKIHFTIDLNTEEKLEDKVIVNIRPEVWLKMWGLVSSESGEIGWHGIVEKQADKIYEITDILLYPQYVSGATVQTDDVEYGNWLHREISDEAINHLRMHGHSHVNMSTHPSGVDTTWYNQILQGLAEDDFYIFMILNKREDYFIEIYDLANNTIYEKKDIVINVILEDNNYLMNWITREKNKALKQKTYEYNRLPSVKTLDDIKPFDAVADEEEKENFEDLLVNITSADLKDEGLMKGIMVELEQRALWNGYFNIGYLEWNCLQEAEKLEVAQEYYMKKFNNNVKDKQIQHNKKKKKRGYSWEGYYG